MKYFNHFCLGLQLFLFCFHTNYGFYRVQGFRSSLLIRSLTMIASDSSSGTETLTHLQLQEMTDQSTPPVNQIDSSPDDCNLKSLDVHEFVNADGKILCACTSSRSTLEHLALYLDRTNYSENTLEHNVFYRKSQYTNDDKAAYDKYLEVFQSGRMLISSPTYEELWSEGGSSAATRKKTTLSTLLKNNVRRYLRMVENSVMCDKINLYLRSQKLDTKYQYDPLRTREEHMVLLQDFANWFRATFPYYYGQCLQCNDRPSASYLGTLHPNAVEKSDGQAGRVELYTCGKCGAYSRFPRFIDVSEVLATRRGRCGEYSVLSLVMLRRLGYAARWVVDRDDHVWVEISISSDWTHFDPCEASINNPTLYEDWGKRPTFVLAFDHDLEGKLAGIIDVTAAYVRDASGVAARRREEAIEEEDVASKIKVAERELLSGVQAVGSIRGLR